MNQQIVHQTIKGWIASCKTSEQLAVTHDAVIKLFDNPYHAAGSKESEELHGLCMQRNAELKLIYKKIK
jgi:hypothetical protein